MTALPDHLNLIDGAWTRGRSGATFGNENPAARGSNLGSFAASTPEDVDAAIGAAARAFSAWRATPLTKRQEYVS